MACAVPAPEELQKLKLNPLIKHICINYSDNGIGFGKESEQKIFTIFHRLHSRNQYECTGIGLAICKKIVEHHRGDISAEGIPGKGAIFNIVIPVQHSSEEIKLS